MRLVASFVAGVLFAVGLCVSGMTDPAKVQGFLDVTGAWDPSLAFVMAGAIGAHFFVARWALRSDKPLFATSFAWPELTKIDLRLVGGAALFGIGWGLVGYCPGPALASLAAPSRPLFAFVVAMAIATVVTRKALERAEKTESKTASAPAQTHAS